MNTDKLKRQYKNATSTGSALRAAHELILVLEGEANDLQAQLKASHAHWTAVAEALGEGEFSDPGMVAGKATRLNVDLARVTGELKRTRSMWEDCGRYLAAVEKERNKAKQSGRELAEHLRGLIVELKARAERAEQDRDKARAETRHETEIREEEHQMMKARLDEVHAELEAAREERDSARRSLGEAEDELERTKAELDAARACASRKEYDKLLKDSDSYAEAAEQAIIERNAARAEIAKLKREANFLYSRLCLFEDVNLEDLGK